MPSKARRQGDLAAAPPADAPPRNRRGRPSLRQAGFIDQRVLDSARACFLENGFSGTTMDAIAAHAGVTKVTLYQRHADKEALLRAVMHERIATWSIISRERTSSRGETLDQRLRHYGRSVLRWSADDEIRAFAELIRGCWGAAPSVAQEMEAIRTGRMLDVLEQDIVELSAKEGLAVDRPRRLAEMFLGMLTAFTELAASPSSNEPAIAAYADQAVDILMKGREAWAHTQAPALDIPGQG